MDGCQVRKTRGEEGTQGVGVRVTGPQTPSYRVLSRKLGFVRFRSPGIAVDGGVLDVVEDRCLWVLRGLVGVRGIET